MDDLMKELAEVAGTYGPEAMAAVRNAVMIQGVLTLFYGVAGCVMAAVLGASSVWLWKKAGRVRENNQRDCYELVYVLALLLGGVGVTFACVSLADILDPWTWIAITHPDYWLAKQMLKL